MQEIQATHNEGGAIIIFFESEEKLWLFSSLTVESRLPAW
jgi:hypothetical protein